VPGPVCRLGDKNDAGGAILTGDPLVLVNGKPVAVFGSKVSPHPDGHAAATTTSKNPSVLVNGKPIVTFGDIDTCGHKRIQGSTNVIVGK
jgi:uncharacterized Zn-binding protein involved in type VI secretion